MKRWQRGDTVVLRYPMEQRMMRCYQVIAGDPVVKIPGWPHVVLQDTDELVAVYMPEGAQLLGWGVAEDRLLTSRASQGDSVRLFFPGKQYEVSLFYETGSGPAPHVLGLFPGVEGRFYGWKIDITSPFARTEAGFDMIDETLDIMVAPDRTFRWKDEDQMAIFVELGIYAAAEAEALRAVGWDVLKLVEAHAPPFDDFWPNWRSDPDLKLGPIPDGWQYVPVPAPYLTYDLTEDTRARLEAAARLGHRRVYGG
ncbi:MAG: DUF402 domain-containing protein [Dehalococcoidia bacterium]|nr:DUF402 domain-containing protein [Dehalococcoidia bacterium]